MNLEFLQDYMILVVMGICLCVGYVIKHIVPTDKINKYIPLIMAVLGVALNMWVNWAISPEILLGGLASGLASTGMHQLFKKFIGHNTDNTDNDSADNTDSYTTG